MPVSLSKIVEDHFRDTVIGPPTFDASGNLPNMVVYPLFPAALGPQPPAMVTLKPVAAPFFDELRSAGILFDSPEAAARKANEVWPDVQGWWQQEHIRDVRQRFAGEGLAGFIQKPYRSDRLRATLREVLGN